MQTNQPIDKAEVITLILADMRNRKLIMGLEATGLDTDEFNTNLSYLILSKMGIAKQYEICVCNWYEDTVYDLLDTDLNKFREQQDFLAEQLYYALEEKRDRLPNNLLYTEKKRVTFWQWIWSNRFDN